MLKLRTLMILMTLATASLAMAQEFYDDPAGVRSFHETRIGDAMGLNNNDLTQYIKNDAEVDNYIQCYMEQVLPNKGQREARLAEYNANYVPFIKHAVQAFQMPYALSACVMFKETKMDNTAVSSANAQSIAQFTEDTYNDLRDLFKTLDRRKREFAEFEKLTKEQEIDPFTSKNENFFVKCYQHATGKGPHVRSVSNTKLVPGTNTTYRQQSKRNCETKLNEYYFNKSLDQELKAFLYNSSRGMTGTTRKKYFPNTPTGQWPEGRDLRPPSTFQEAKNNPMWLSALNILYLKKMTLNADMRFNPNGFQASHDYLGFLAVIAGSYNRGPGALNSIVGKENGSIKKWCDKLKGSTETKNYMLSIKRCLAKGSNFAVTEKGFRDSTCNNSSPLIKNITDPCDLLQSTDGKVYDMTQPGEPVICDPSKGEDCSSYTTDQ